jgi:iron(III) transport system substrate-binding protein
MRTWRLLLILSALLPCVGVTPSAHAQAKTELWVYTSVYKEFIAPIAQAFERKHPEISVQVFQGGSEKIQTKVEAELAADRPQADLVMVSDPFWADKLSKRGFLKTLPSGSTFEVGYYSLMVMVAHKDFPQAKRPKKWKDLTDPSLNHLVYMGSPLESGTAFAAVAYLQMALGWDYFDSLRKNGIGCSGGNSAVIQKVESGEKKVGVVLLENALAAIQRGSPIDVIYPEDGGIPIPSVQVIPRVSPHAEEAQKFEAFLLSSEGQELLKKGYMYPANPKAAPPAGALPYAQATKGSTAWTNERISQVADHAKDIKNKFDDLVLE